MTNPIITQDGEYEVSTYPDGHTTRKISTPIPVSVYIDPAINLIDVGSFFDRFGASKMAILTSQDIVIKAMILDITVRPYIDLTNQDLITGLGYITTVLPQFTTAKVTEILTTPITYEESSVLRRLYF
jgi:hypothetical protein